MKYHPNNMLFYHLYQFFITSSFLLYTCYNPTYNVQITNYPGEEILIVYDPDYKYGENFYVCLTEAGKAEYLDSLKKEEEEAEEGS